MIADDAYRCLGCGRRYGADELRGLVVDWSEGAPDVGHWVEGHDGPPEDADGPGPGRAAGGAGDRPWHAGDAGDGDDGCDGHGVRDDPAAPTDERGHERLPQVNLGLFYSEKTHRPPASTSTTAP